MTAMGLPVFWFMLWQKQHISTLQNRPLEVSMCHSFF